MRYDNSREVIANEWSSDVALDVTGLSNKLENCCMALEVWSKFEVSGLHEKELPSLLQQVSLDGKMDEVSRVKAFLYELYSQDEIFWKQRSKDLW